MSKLLDNKGVRDRFIAARGNGGDITNACNYAGISRQTFYLYVAANPDFLAECDAKLEETTNKVRDWLVEIAEMRRERPTAALEAIKFYLKNLNKNVFTEEVNTNLAVRLNHADIDKMKETELLKVLQNAISEQDNDSTD